MLKNKLRRVAEIAKDRRYVGFYFQRRFSRFASRKMASDIISKLKPQSGALWSDAVPLCDSSVFDTYGLARLPGILSQEQVSDIVGYFGALKTTDPYRSELGAFPAGVRPSPSSHVAYHDTKDVMMAPHILDFANDPRVLKTVSEYFGCIPTISYLAAWWSFPTERSAQQAELFHRDVDDFKFLKLFVYLTDVDESSGPHVYVANSVSSSELRKIKRFSRDDVLGKFPAESELVLCGKGGDGFLENTQGLHRGLPVNSGRRLIFQIVYSLSAMPYGPRQPVIGFSESNQYNKWVNRVYVQR